jgi:RimJ/RimL family protein N-acetyltransferase
VTPFALWTERLTLDQPTPLDEQIIAEYCQDPSFEQFLTIPWPYTVADARYFVRDFVPAGWESGAELTWAIRSGLTDEFLGVIGFRVLTRDLGFWLGVPHRGNGYMSEATSAIADWVFSSELGIDQVVWEAIAGNAASSSVARKVGFTFTGSRPSTVVFRDGTYPESWHGRLRATDTREPKPGWPIV